MKYNKLIFVDTHGTSRAPMALALFNHFELEQTIIAEARGLVVLFGEPMNRKVEAVLKSHSLEIPNYLSQQLEESDVSLDTLFLAMEEEQVEKILEKYPEANAEVLTRITGDELEVMDPFGGPLPSYGLCFESMHRIIEKLMIVLSEGE